MPHNLGLLFASIVEQQPNEPALVWEQRTWSFGELDAFANALVGWLSRAGVAKGDVIAIQLPKCPEAYALVIACLKMGAIYVFLDVRNPELRTQQMIDRCAPKLLFTAGRAKFDVPRMEHLTDEDERLRFRSSLDDDNSSNGKIRFEITGTDPAYIMFTSGSTGEPKGAVIPHAGVLSLIAWAKTDLQIDRVQRLTNINPLHFDNSVFDIYGGLFNGASIAPLETSQSVNPIAWVRSITARQCSLFFGVPTLFMYLDTLGLLSPEKLPTIRTFMFGGEGYPLSKLAQFYRAFVTQSRLVNVYGPTETSCICSSYEITEETFSKRDGFPSLGPIHRNFEYAILDEKQDAVTLSDAGELWLGGPCVGLGYYNNPSATAERFQQDPRHAKFRSIWYRTGDLVVEDSATCRLYFKGRVDNQVKIRGHRIELEELENVVTQHDKVQRCIAVVRGIDGWDEIHVALVGRPGLNLDDLQQHCETRLPGYMVPNLFVVMDELPVNPNGKIDRRVVKAMLAESSL